MAKIVIQERRSRKRVGPGFGIAALVFMVLLALLSAAVMLGFDLVDRVFAAGPGTGANPIAHMVEQVARPSISIAVGILIALLMVLRGWRQQALLLLGTVGIAGATGALMKLLISRERPPGAEVGQLDLAASFPSGHVTMATAMLLGLVFALTEPGSTGRKVGAVLAVLVSLLVGFGRVVGGAHFPSDVVGGLLLGAASACFAEWLLGTYWRVSPPAPVTRWLRSGRTT